MSTPVTNVTVQVPTEYLGQFYELFASWYDAATAAAADRPPRTLRRWDAADDAHRGAMEAVWLRVTGRTRDVLRELAGAPGGRLPVRELARRLDVDVTVVSGAPLWPRRIAAGLGFVSPVSVVRQVDGAHCVLDPEAALLLRRVLALPERLAG